MRLVAGRGPILDVPGRPDVLDRLAIGARPVVHARGRFMILVDPLFDGLPVVFAAVRDLPQTATFLPRSYSSLMRSDEAFYLQTIACPRPGGGPRPKGLCMYAVDESHAETLAICELVNQIVKFFCRLAWACLGDEQ